MNNIIEAAARIFDFASEADVRCMPELTLEFNTGGDRARFETLLRHKTDPGLGMDATHGRPPHEYQFQGLVIKLAVKVDHGWR